MSMPLAVCHNSICMNCGELGPTRDVYFFADYQAAQVCNRCNIIISFDRNFGIGEPEWLDLQPLRKLPCEDVAS